MASQVRFDPPNVEGLVAAGTTVAAAAERLGVGVTLECGGVGECTSCAVQMVENPFALSEVAEAERRQLGDERIASGVRLACQARIREGDCVIRVLTPARPDEPADGEEPAAAGGGRERILEDFANLPTAEQVSTAIELQLKVAGDLLGAIVEVPLRAGEELFSSIFGPGPGQEDDSKGKEGDRADAPADGTDDKHE
jgi:2Fe-2S ferredoxin